MCRWLFVIYRWSSIARGALSRLEEAREAGGSSTTTITSTTTTTTTGLLPLSFALHMLTGLPLFTSSDCTSLWQRVLHLGLFSPVVTTTKPPPPRLVVSSLSYLQSYHHLLTTSQSSLLLETLCKVVVDKGLEASPEMALSIAVVVLERLAWQGGLWKLPPTTKACIYTMAIKGFIRHSYLLGAGSQVKVVK